MHSLRWRATRVTSLFAGATQAWSALSEATSQGKAEVGLSFRITDVLPGGGTVGRLENATVILLPEYIGICR